jgi:hypothetical protein
MNEATVNLILVDALAGYLGSGKTAAQVARDVSTPNVGSGNSDSDHRLRIRQLMGSTEDSIAAFFDSLIGHSGSDGELTRDGSLYSVA